MPPPSIQSFFTSSPSKSEPGDGFTPEERTLAPSSTDWTPTLDYEECDIGSLQPGPCILALMGRIANFYDVSKPSKHSKSAQGYIKIMLIDDTGAMTVRLWYAQNEYRLRLGQLVTLWTVHISQGSESLNLAPSAAPLFTSIFPEGERHCHFMVHERNDDGTMFKRPFGSGDGQVLPGLMTLKNFTDGGYDVDECKLLVCVKSIGARKKCIPHPSLPLTTWRLETLIGLHSREQKGRHHRVYHRGPLRRHRLGHPHPLQLRLQHR